MSETEERICLNGIDGVTGNYLVQPMSAAEAVAMAQCHLLWAHLGAFLLAERRKPPGFPTVIPDGSRRAATK